MDRFAQVGDDLVDGLTLGGAAREGGGLTPEPAVLRLVHDDLDIHAVENTGKARLRPDREEPRRRRMRGSECFWQPCLSQSGVRRVAARDADRHGEIPAHGAGCARSRAFPLP